jgi:hypothetical protein
MRLGYLPGLVRPVAQLQQTRSGKVILLRLPNVFATLGEFV